MTHLNSLLTLQEVSGLNSMPFYSQLTVNSTSRDMRMDTSLHIGCSDIGMCPSLGSLMSPRVTIAVDEPQQLFYVAKLVLGNY